MAHHQHRRPVAPSCQRPCKVHLSVLWRDIVSFSNHALVKRQHSRIVQSHVCYQSPRPCIQVYRKGERTGRNRMRCRRLCHRDYCRTATRVVVPAPGSSASYISVESTAWRDVCGCSSPFFCNLQVPAQVCYPRALPKP